MEGLRAADAYQWRLIEAVTVTDLSVHELWLRYLSASGTADVFEVEAYMSGLATMSVLDHNILTLVVNERLEEMGHRGAAPYRQAGSASLS